MSAQSIKADSLDQRNKPHLSAVWVYSEEDPELAEILRQYLVALRSLPCPCELVLVNNGTGQETEAELTRVLQESELPATIISIHQSFDESVAMSAGLEATQGDVVALLPPYLQIDPFDLRRMLEAIDDGYDYVASWRSPRVDSKVQRLNSAVFNRLTSYLTGVRLHDVNSGLRMLRRRVAEEVPLYGDLYRFLPILVAKQGYRVTEVKTRHLQERIKKGDYHLGVYLRRILDLLALFFLIKFTRKPLRFFGLIGTVMLATGTAIMGVVCVQRLMGTALANRPALLFGVLLIVLGIQLFSLGLLGELIIFTHGKRLRDYHVEKTYENPPKS